MSDVLSLQCAAGVTLMDAPMVRRTDVRADLAARTAAAASPPARPAGAARRPAPSCRTAHPLTHTGLFGEGGNGSLSSLKQI